MPQWSLVVFWLSSMQVLTKGGWHSLLVLLLFGNEWMIQSISGFDSLPRIIGKHLLHQINKQSSTKSQLSQDGVGWTCVWNCRLAGRSGTWGILIIEAGIQRLALTPLHQWARSSILSTIRMVAVTSLVGNTYTFFLNTLSKESGSIYVPLQCEHGQKWLGQERSRLWKKRLAWNKRQTFQEIFSKEEQILQWFLGVTPWFWLLSIPNLGVTIFQYAKEIHHRWRLFLYHRLELLMNEGLG